jgi:hypothetical protein
MKNSVGMLTLESSELKMGITNICSPISFDDKHRIAKFEGLFKQMRGTLG